MKKKVYIAGPITNNPNYKEEFSAVAEKLKKIGLEPVNPADAPEGLTYKEYIDMGLKKLMDCNAICCIVKKPGATIRFPNSQGERLEYQYATTVGLPVMLAWRTKPYDNKGKLQSAEWIIEIPKCWPGMFGEEDEQ